MCGYSEEWKKMEDEKNQDEKEPKEPENAVFFEIESDEEVLKHLNLYFPR